MKDGFIKVFRDEDGSIRLVTNNGEGQYVSVLDTNGAQMIARALNEAALMNDQLIQEEEQPVIKPTFITRLLSFFKRVKSKS